MIPRPADFDDPAIAAFCQTVAPGQEPDQIPSRPTVGASENDCFEIVRLQIERHGGEAVTGWALWEYPRVFVEAEFHQVWRSPDDGALVDLNPRPFPWAVISFLPDPSRRYEGVQVDNIRRPFVGDVDLLEYLSLLRRAFEITNEGDLARQHGLIELTGERAAEHDRIVVRTAELQATLYRRYFSGNP